MIKRVNVDVLGSGNEPTEGMVVNPETTAKEILSQVGLDGYELCASLSEMPFAENEPIYNKVTDGSVLSAYRPATAGE